MGSIRRLACWAMACLLAVGVSLPQIAAGKDEHAIKHLSNLIKDNPQFEWAYYARGIARSKAGDHEGAKFDFVIANKLNPSFKIPSIYAEEVIKERQDSSVSGQIRQFLQRLDFLN